MKTVSVCIPAHNEAANIGRLLHDILAQTEKGYRLAEILVFSDGSTDATRDETLAAGDPRIHFRDYQNRTGKTTRINQLIQASRGDIILLLDADIRIPDPSAISQAVKQFDPIRHGLLGFNATPLTGRTFTERSLNASIAVTQRVRKTWNDGANYLSFRGAALMLSRSFADQINLPASLVTNDAYLMFLAIRLGFTPVYAPAIQVYYRSPGTIADHLKQSRRFQYSVEEIEALLPGCNARAAYRVPMSLLIKATLAESLHQPIYIANYILLTVYTRLQKQKPSTAWEMATSTKEVGGQVRG